MSFKQFSSLVAAAAATFVLSAVAYADGKSPNGPPGPAGNPNQPASQPEANAPAGPQGNSGQGNSGESHGKSDADHGKSDASHGKSNAAPGKSKSNGSRPSTPHGNHANPNPGTPRKGGREDRPAPKITICHATRSVKNPYVEITISVNGLHGHGPTADDPVSRHHAGSWKDIIPAPAGGCPTTVTPPQGENHGQQPQTTNTTNTTTTTPTQPAAGEQTAPAVATQPAAQLPAGAQAVLGERVAGTSAPSHKQGKGGPQTEVLGANASGGSAPKSAQAVRAAAARGGSLPFTGTQLAFVLIIAGVALLGGVALRRAVGSRA